MRLSTILPSIAAFIALTAPAFAHDGHECGDWCHVPEIGADGSLAAIAAVAATAAIIWQRRRNRS
jgi:hypothetical protein